MALRMTEQVMNGVTVINCDGRIVFGEEAGALREKIKGLLPGTKQIVLNLAGVSYIDSGGIGVMVSLFTSARSAGGDIKLANLTKRVGDLLQITKLLTVFDVFDDEKQAVAAYAKSSSTQNRAVGSSPNC